MKQQVKDRLEQINQGIVPEGYKKTEIGIIPEDWAVKNFKDIFVVSQGLQIPIKERFTEYKDGLFIYVTNEYLNNIKKSRKHNAEYIEKPKENVICSKDDILMTRTGNTGLVVTDVEGVFHNNFFKISFNRELFSKEYLVYLLKGNSIQYEITRLAGTSTIPDLTHSDFYSLKANIPGIYQQQKIADVLSTWDRAIELKESLIREKGIQKKGLVQYLMNLKYDNNLENLQLINVLDYQQPGKFITDNIFEKGTIPVLTANKSFIIGYTNDVDGVYDDYPIILFDDFTTDIKYVDFPFKVRSSAIKILELKNKNKADLKYLFERMTLIKHPRGSHKRYYISEYQYININLPSLVEQQRIAEILSTADKEIELLKDEVVELKEQKKGLMQLLLTGIIRVGEEYHA